MNLQPPPPPAAVLRRAEGKRPSISPAPRGPLPAYLEPGERVKAHALVHLSKHNHTMVQSRSLFAGKIIEVKDDGDVFRLLFDDRDAQDVPAAWIQRRDFSRGRTWAEVKADQEGGAGRCKKKQKRKTETGMDWRLEGLHTAFVRADDRADDQEDESSMLDRLVFRAQVGYRVHGQWVTKDTPEEVSLRSILEDQATEHETNVYLKAMYEMMQVLFHTTPTEAGRVELLGAVDPFDEGHAHVAAVRAEIYSEHRRLAALSAADARARQGAGGGAAGV
jgi:hypothetical protein